MTLQRRFRPIFVGGSENSGERAPERLQCWLAMKVFEPFRLDTVNHCVWRAEDRLPPDRLSVDLNGGEDGRRAALRGPARWRELMDA